MKDKRNRHGAVGKSSSEQHFRKSSYGRLAGRLAGWQAGRRNTGEFLNFQSWL